VVGAGWRSGIPSEPTRRSRNSSGHSESSSDRNGGWAAFYQIGPDHAATYRDLGLGQFKLGEEARIRLDDFALEGRERKSLRAAHNHGQRKGLAFEIVPRDAVPAVLPELRQISTEWLVGKCTGEKGFSLGFFDEGYLRNFPIAIVRTEGQTLAFANVLEGPEKEELSVDLMRHRMEAPHGLMDYLLVELMLWGKDAGYRWFNLGMAPLAGLASGSLAPLWDRAGAFLFQHGEHFYNFEGLRDYKAKFDPVWSPRYLACPGGLALPFILADIAALVAGGTIGVVAHGTGPRHGLVTQPSSLLSRGG
jgi:phosphatidylglycerol lysyltransferase